MSELAFLKIEGVEDYDQADNTDLMLLEIALSPLLARGLVESWATMARHAYLRPTLQGLAHYAATPRKRQIDKWWIRAWHEQPCPHADDERERLLTLYLGSYERQQEELRQAVPKSPSQLQLLPWSASA